MGSHSDSADTVIETMTHGGSRLWPVSTPLSQLVMRRSLRIPLPELPALPVGYSLRLLTRSECEPLTNLLADAFPEVGWTHQKTDERLLEAPDVKATYVIERDGLLVGTASVRYLTPLFPDAGIVHWVAVRRSERGKSFGRILTCQVCSHISAEGNDEAVLETDDFRLPAIRTYRAVGFEPFLRDPTHGERWDAILKKIEGPSKEAE